MMKMLKYTPKPYTIAIVEVGERYIGRVISTKTDHCSMKEAQKIAKDAGYQVIPDLCTIVPSTHEIHIVVAVEEEVKEE